MGTDGRLGGNSRPVDESSTLAGIQAQLRALELLAANVESDERRVPGEYIGLSDEMVAELRLRQFEGADTAKKEHGSVPILFGEFIPRTQLLPEEIEAGRQFSRIADTVAQPRSIAWTIVRYLVLGLFVGAVFNGALFFSNEPQWSALSSGMHAVLGSSSRAQESPSVDIGHSIAFRSEGGSIQYASLDIPKAILDHVDLTYVWLRDLPLDAVASQGLRFRNGVWVLYKSQLGKLNVTVPRSATPATTISIDFVRADGALIGQLNHRLDPVRSNLRNSGLDAGSRQ
jgi:hypothetical protein